MSSEKYPTNCPDCGAKMIEDAWEIIDFLPNGNIQIKSIHPAWICSKMCGYFVEMENDS